MQPSVLPPVLLAGTERKFLHFKAGCIFNQTPVKGKGWHPLSSPVFLSTTPRGHTSFFETVQTNSASVGWSTRLSFHSVISFGLKQ